MNKKRRRLLYPSPYVECPNCHEVVNDVNQKLLKVDEPAPCCGASGEARTLWPAVGVLMLIGVVSNQDLDSEEGRNIAVVFLSTAMELLHEDSLWYLLQLHTKSRQLLELILDTNRGKERRINLYNKLSDRSLGDLLNSSKLANFLEDWKKLAERRNNILHKQFCYSKANVADLVRRILGNCLRAFTAVRNDVQRQIREKRDNSKK